MSRINPKLCPFSKALIGDWCTCPYAILAERCSGKMLCGREQDYLQSCISLSDILQQKSSFVLGVNDAAELTHAQLMKVRIGGLLGMQRVIAGSKNALPAVRSIIDSVEAQYGCVEQFPFNEIMPDIRQFHHRKAK